MCPTKPWLKFYGDVPHCLDYPRKTMYEALMQTVARSPEAVAYDFLGTTSTYRAFGAAIDRCADALAGLGLKPGDRLTIAMPTCPQAVICFYAVNKLGGVASMIHPLSTAAEIEFFLNLSRSRVALTLDAFYSKFKAVKHNTALQTLILSRIPDYLSWIKRLGFNMTTGRKIPKVPAAEPVTWWADMMRDPYPPADKGPANFEDLAVILYSGGTTGKPKGIMLSNRNFICEGMQVSAWGQLTDKDAILAILPVFHGFGLGVCLNAAFMGGARSIMVPRFSPQDVAKLIRAKKPDVIIGVPTLFEALNQDAVFQNSDLRCLKAAFCGADTLPRCIKERFESIIAKRGGCCQLREGYGLTEAVTAVMAMPLGEYRENSVGVPFPDMEAKIVRPGTTETRPPGEEGEICLHGPAVMMGYLDNPEETAKALQQHDDGRIWLHTGDIGTMDADGFFYFKLREKRMIKSSGMNVYPAQVEEQLYKHPEVKEACVIGVPDARQMERVKAFVVLKNSAKAGPEMEKELIGFCRRDLIVWSCPREIEFRLELPLTLVGKIAFAQLLTEELEKLGADANVCRQ
jgi:long-chain acyl-CoA synthetase